MSLHNLQEKLINVGANQTAAALIAGALVGQQPEPTTIEGRPVLLLPNGLQIHDLEKYLPAPKRLVQGVTLATPASFADYVNLFGEPARTVIFADEENDRFEAVIDYHAAGDRPSWATHRAICTLAHTQAWSDWTEKDRTAMDQTAFAQFMEDHIPQIASPDGATLVEIARTFEAAKSVTFQSHRRAEDGSIQFRYDEVVQGSAKAGTVAIPAKFHLHLTPYFGGQAYPVVARLRYRIKAGGVLELSYEMEQLEDIVEAAFADVVEDLTKRTAERVRAIVRGVSK